MAKRRNSTNFTSFYGGLSGFQPELGFDYTIELNEYEIAEPLQDASSIEYEFLKLENQEILLGIFRRDENNRYDLISTSIH